MRRQLMILVLGGLVGVLALSSDASACCHKRRCAQPCVAAAPCAPAPCATACAPRKHCRLFGGGGGGLCHKRRACYAAPVCYAAPAMIAPSGQAATPQM